MANCDFCGNPLSDAQYLLVKDVVYKSCPNCSVDSKQHIHYVTMLYQTNYIGI